MYVEKISGEKEPFDVNKLKQSLFNAGAQREFVEAIAADIEAWMVDGITTKKIYARAFAMLRGMQTKAALRYKLKQAILQFGATGYPFEQLVSKVFEGLGYTVRVGDVAQGHCIPHEVDVLATKDKTQYFIECKYSRNQDRVVRIQTPLYVQARMEDIIKKQKTEKQYRDFTFSSWLVTNTRFSADSIAYGECAGLRLLGWNYPPGNGLKEMIEQAGIYPITLLSRLNRKEKTFLIEKGIVICAQLWKNPKVLEDLKLSRRKYNGLMAELQAICE